MPRASRTAPILLVLAFVLTACGGSDDGPLNRWTGEWQAAEPLFLNPTTNAAYEAIHDLRNEYSVDEIRSLFLATADVDYTSLRIEPNELIFSNGDDVVCAGRYVVATHPDDPEPGPTNYTDFTVDEVEEGDCGRFDTVSMTALLPEDAVVHFHIVSSSPAGRLMPAPWNPSAWEASMTVDVFAGRLEAAAPAIAGSLPPK